MMKRGISCFRQAFSPRLLNSSSGATKNYCSDNAADVINAEMSELAKKLGVKSLHKLQIVDDDIEFEERKAKGENVVLSKVFKQVCPWSRAATPEEIEANYKILEKAAKSGFYW